MKRRVHRKKLVFQVLIFLLLLLVLSWSVSAVCKDTDGGNKPYVYGKVSIIKPKATYTDSCKNISGSSVLTEYYCNSSASSEYSKLNYYCNSCGSPSVCSTTPPAVNITPFVSKYSCTENDGGNNPYVAGEVYTNATTGYYFPDSCRTSYDANSLQEWYCNSSDINAVSGVAYYCNSCSSPTTCVPSSDVRHELSYVDSDGGVDALVYGELTLTISHYNKNSGALISTGTNIYKDGCSLYGENGLLYDWYNQGIGSTYGYPFTLANKAINCTYDYGLGYSCVSGVCVLSQTPPETIPPPDGGPPATNDTNLSSTSTEPVLSQEQSVVENSTIVPLLISLPGDIQAKISSFFRWFFTY